MSKPQEKISIREYSEEDKEDVLALFRLNTPQYFSREEEKDLVDYLNTEIELYYVVEIEDTLVGSGGMNFKENHTVGFISWDIIHPDIQGKGVGSLLLKHRIDVLKFKGIQKIIVRTSQLTYPFYEKAGFETIEQIKDYWATGYDLYKMEYRQL
jgi:N-acetylglutamate synthase-like GNAT family acetyltransferase